MLADAPIVPVIADASKNGNPSNAGGDPFWRSAQNAFGPTWETPICWITLATAMLLTHAVEPSWRCLVGRASRTLKMSATEAVVNVLAVVGDTRLPVVALIPGQRAIRCTGA